MHVEKSNIKSVLLLLTAISLLLIIENSKYCRCLSLITVVSSVDYKSIDAYVELSNQRGTVGNHYWKFERPPVSL